MEKRKFDRLSIETSLLGFGCMRFPTKDGEIDEETAEKMLDRAYDAGITYFDTARPYHGGKSEPFLGKVMEKHPRDSFYFATKLPPWEVNSLDDAKRIFELQLNNLRTDYIDFYLLHALDKAKFEQLKNLKVIEYCEQLKAEGKIRYLGFSFHDDYDTFEKIATYRDWDFCQIQYNYMDRAYQAGDRGYALAEKLNLPLVIMEPLRGGTLCSYAPDVEKIFKDLRPNDSIASWGLRWLGSKPQIKVILSGMSAPDQLEDNLKTVMNFESLTEEELKTVDKVVEEVNSRKRNVCTGCRYCMPCPGGLDIPRMFRIWNRYGMFGNKNAAKDEYFNHMKDSERADMCLRCGACEEACPQHLQIREDLEKLHSEISSL